MTMSESELEQRLLKLERELEVLRAKVEQSPKLLPWWERIAGTFHNDPAYKEAMELGRQYRQSQRDDFTAKPE